MYITGTAHEHHRTQRTQQRNASAVCAYTTRAHVRARATSRIADTRSSSSVPSAVTEIRRVGSGRESLRVTANPRERAPGPRIRAGVRFRTPESRDRTPARSRGTARGSAHGAPIRAPGVRIHARVRIRAPAPRKRARVRIRDLPPRTHAPVCSRTPIHERMEGPGYACLHVVSSEERIRIILI